MKNQLRNTVYICVIFLILPTFLWAANETKPAAAYYSLEGNRFEVRTILPDKATNGIELTSADNRKFRVGETKLLDPEDFEGIELQERYVLLYLKHDAWRKARKALTQSVNERIAIIINQKLYAAPFVHIPLWKSLPLSQSGNFSGQFETYVSDLKKAKKPAFIGDQKLEKAFIQSVVSEFPEDIHAVKDLAYLYLPGYLSGNYDHSAMSKNCDRAIPLLKKITGVEPQEVFHYATLYDCYMLQNNYPTAVDAIEASLPNQMPHVRWVNYVKIGKAYLAAGSTKKALKAFNQAKSSVKTIPMVPEPSYMDLATLKMLMRNEIEPEVMRQIDTVEELDRRLKLKANATIDELISQTKSKS